MTAPGVTRPGSFHAESMLGFDLDHPLDVNGCDRCAAPDWRDCICDPSRPNRNPTPDEIEAARRERLTRAERGPGQ